LVARECAQRRELARDDARRKVGIVVGRHVHLRSGQACADQPRDFFGAHAGSLHRSAVTHLPDA
jgi:hypothetical protein